MDHPRQQYPFLSNSHDLFNSKEMERRHSLYQLSSDQRQHSYALPHHLTFQHPFNHQQMQPHISQMVPQHFAQDFTFGLPYDHMPHGLMEHDDSNEPTTRPRLTKEQVDFFEREFAANSKPPSTYKRALALQTNIDYNRISNWFQNRRAKAKQQKKQEEFEKSQRKVKDDNGDATPQAAADDDEDDDEEEEDEEHFDSVSKGSESPTFERKDGKNHANTTNERRSVGLSAASSVASQSSSPTRGPESAKERSWASLQRALAAAKAANSSQHQQQQQSEQQQHTSFRNQPLQIMLPPRVPTKSPVHDRTNLGRVQRPNAQASMMLTVPSQMTESHPDRFGWQHQPVTSSGWPASTINASDMHFDFGFSQMGSTNTDEAIDLISPTDTRSQTVMLPSEDWNNSLDTPTMPASSQMAYSQSLHSPGSSFPAYDESRRGSLADGLSANFENFGVDAESPSLDASPSLSSLSGNEYDGNRTDLAARRKRPVPTLAIRSHSYGAPTAKSPTCRPGVTPPQTHSLRHSKSAGHGLSAYAGVRKSSLATKSPLGLTFDGNNLDRLMAQSNDINLRQPLMPVSTNTAGSRHLHDQMMASFQALQQNRMHLGEIGRHRSIQTPPITPFQLGFESQTPTVIPPTTQAQYANCSETPPFSAGPRTASSCQWSDAGVTSPDIQHFPPVYCLPSYPYMNGDEQSGMHSLFSTDQTHDLGMGLSADKKQPEWFSHTFDGQDTVYAQIAQQIGNKGPKEYTFDNSSLSSFRGKSQSH